MELILGLLWELVVQVVFELVGEALVELGFHGAKWVVRHWTARTVTLALLGLGGGWVWGHVLHDRGRTAMPRTFWVSLAIAGAAGMLLARRVGEPAGTGDDRPLAPPWRWGARRLAGFALLSLAVALGVWWGF